MKLTREIVEKALQEPMKLTFLEKEGVTRSNETIYLSAVQNPQTVLDLMDERDALREALQKIVTPKGHMPPDRYLEGACWMQEIAEEALAKGGNDVLQT